MPNALLSCPSHNTPTGCYSGALRGHHHLSSSVPGIFLTACNTMNYTLIHDSTHSPAWGTHSRHGVGSHHAHRTGRVYGHSKPCKVGTAQHLTAVWRAKGVTHFTEEKLLCSGVTGKQLEQRASLSSQSDRGKSNRNLGLSRQKESYSQCGNRGKGSL